MPRDAVSRMPSRFRPYKVFFGRWSVAVSIIILVGAALMPADGIGVGVCQLKAVSGHDCPGCGLSRSARNLAHGDPGLAFSHHPFGFIVLPYAVVAVSSLFWSPSVRRHVRCRMNRRRRIILRAGQGMLALFLLFGLTRSVLSMLAT